MLEEESIFLDAIDALALNFKFQLEIIKGMGETRDWGLGVEERLVITFDLMVETWN